MRFFILILAVSLLASCVVRPPDYRDYVVYGQKHVNGNLPQKWIPVDTDGVTIKIR